MAEATTQLRRELGLRDLVLFNCRGAAQHTVDCNSRTCRFRVALALGAGGNFFPGPVRLLCRSPVANVPGTGRPLCLDSRSVR